MGSIVDLGKERRSRGGETVCDKRQDAVAQGLPSPRERRESDRVLGGTFNTFCTLPLWGRLFVAGGRPTLVLGAGDIGFL